MKNRIVSYFNKNTIYKNSIFLLLSNGIASSTGFLFWILVARSYTTEQIGIATALFSLVNLISALSLLGFGTGLLRYLPSSEQKNDKINTVIIITSVVSGIIALIVLAGMQFFSSHLVFIRDNILFAGLFVFFAIITSLNLLIEAILVAFRSSIHVLIKVAVQSAIKLFLPFVFIFLGSIGIFVSIYFGILAGIIYGFIVLFGWYSVRFGMTVKIALVKKMAMVSLGTYISGLAASAPSYVLPILITNVLGPTSNAYYYIAATTVNVLYLIPGVISQNLLVEGSYKEEEIKLYTRKAMRFILITLVPAVLIMIFFGNYILLVFGKDYSTEGITLLRLLAFSGIIVGINYVFSTLMTIFNHIKLLIFVNVLGAIILLVLSYILLQLGLIGVGYAVLITQIVLFLLYTGIFVRIRKISLLFSII